MKEELQGKLVEILTSIQTAAGKASDFAMAELPDIAVQYIAYGRAYETAWMVLTLLAFAAGAGLLAWLIMKKDDPEPVVWMFFADVGLAALVLWQVKLTMLAWLAPKVWLLKEVARMLK
jgi:hypothetical protein